ncbi:hypothetical protein MMC26_001907 [Xylographa opegraphella]|nr:hypothetical protein [Xylographa opegraphella]
MAFNRSKDRNVHIYDIEDPTIELGGLILTNGVTNANFLSMLEILCFFESRSNLQDKGGMMVERNNHPLQPGDYYIVGPLSINNEPSLDNYKFIWFTHDRNNLAGKYLAGKYLAGKYLDQQFLNNPNRPVDQLLRWHFRQAVLINMRGAGEPIFEHDFPPGSDMIGEIRRGPKAAERMEFELYNRLAIQ